MNSGELYEAFRADVEDDVGPYLWKDEEVFRYMDAAYKKFVRLVGGISDATSSITEVPVVTGEAWADVSPLILNFRFASLASTGAKVKVANSLDPMAATSDDYGTIRDLAGNTAAGPVQYMIIGLSRNQVKWVQVPEADDTVNLAVYRLPLEDITGDAQEFEIDAQHHEYLLLGMKELAFLKQDSEAFDRAGSKENKKAFEDYCAAVKAEAERYKHKVREVSYGGL